MRLLGLFLLWEPNRNKEQSVFLEKNSWRKANTRALSAEDSIGGFVTVTVMNHKLTSAVESSNGRTMFFLTTQQLHITITKHLKLKLLRRSSHLLLVEHGVGLLQRVLRTTDRQTDEETHMQRTTERLITTESHLTTSFSAWETVSLVFPPLMIMLLFRPSISLGSRLSRKRLERFVLAFLGEKHRQRIRLKSQEWWILTHYIDFCCFSTDLLMMTHFYNFKNDFHH